MANDNILLPVALETYYQRIGAEVLNFRRAMIKLHSGKYYQERCLIKVGPDGEISVTNKEYAPTEEEQKAIKSGWADSAMPKSILAQIRAAETFSNSLEGQTFLFRSRKEPGIIMIQQRKENEDGDRFFVPWTFWSDGSWRPMEPDGPLPFWKPDKMTATKIMIHEGAKAAQYAQKLADGFRKDGEATHPWAEELSEYEHWGMIGGALAPHRSDYAELTRHNPTEVIYVCDNDWPGNMALPEVSRCYGRKLKGIQFDMSFPVSWDMADPLPKDLFKAGRWNGPSLKDLMKPATWATEIIPAEGKGRPSTKIKREFAEEWFHSIQPEAYAHKDWPSKIYMASEFDHLVRPFSHVAGVSALLQGVDASKGVSLKYNPSMEPGIFNDHGTRALNTHVGTTIKPEKGDVTPFLDYISVLLPIEADRLALLKWVITLIARPDIKMLYGVLLISDQQGVGKSTLGEKILMPLIGYDNVSMPTEKEIVDSDFNYWCAHKRLAVVHEIYAGNSTKPYNTLKSLITDDHITINKKYQASYQIDNWIHILACSNSMNALKLSIDDRRWFVPRVTEVKKPAGYWDDFMNWLREEGGLGIIRQWCIDQAALGNIIHRGEGAPMTQAKKEVIAEGFSPGMKFISERLEELIEDKAGEFFYLTDLSLSAALLQAFYQGRTTDRMEKLLTLRKVAKSLKLFIKEDRIAARTWGGQESRNARVISNDPLVETYSLDKISELTPEDFVERAIKRSQFG